jgi:hypothetical protein
MADKPPEDVGAKDLRIAFAIAGFMVGTAILIAIIASLT